eukprot:scaffold3076_cov154-Skeletonema_dohrnii-CCMP3373.AAC.3
MANYIGSLEAVDCRIYSVRTIWSWRVELAAISDASSGHLRRCSDADTTKECLRFDNYASMYTIVGHQKLLIDL